MESRRDHDGGHGNIDAGSGSVWKQRGWVRRLERERRQFRREVERRADGAEQRSRVHGVERIEERNPPDLVVVRLNGTRDAHRPTARNPTINDISPHIQHAYSGQGGIRDLLEALQSSSGWEPISDGAALIGLADSVTGAAISPPTSSASCWMVK